MSFESCYHNTLIVFRNTTYELAKVLSITGLDKVGVEQTTLLVGLYSLRSVLIYIDVIVCSLGTRLANFLSTAFLSRKTPLISFCKTSAAMADMLMP